MKAESFDSTPAFQRFKDVMRNVLAISKAELEKKIRDESKKSAKKRTRRKRSKE
jgi:hypothetical protein